MYACVRFDLLNRAACNHISGVLRYPNGVLFVFYKGGVNLELSIYSHIQKFGQWLNFLPMIQ